MSNGRDACPTALRHSLGSTNASTISQDGAQNADHIDERAAHIDERAADSGISDIEDHDARQYGEAEHVPDEFTRRSA